MLYASNILIIPYGVQDMNVSSPIINFPTFTGLNPSTSFLQSIFSKASCIFKPFGIGLCNNIPLISFLLFKLFIISSNFSIEVFSSSKISSNSTPTSWQALLLFLTYTFDALSSPTNITANFGTMPFSLSLSTFSFNSSLIFLANSFPSSI